MGAVHIHPHFMAQARIHRQIYIRTQTHGPQLLVQEDTESLVNEQLQSEFVSQILVVQWKNE